MYNPLRLAGAPRYYLESLGPVKAARTVFKGLGNESAAGVSVAVGATAAGSSGDIGRHAVDASVIVCEEAAAQR